MDSDRIKAARTRLWRAWVFGGLLWSVAFLLLASVIVGLFGAERADSLFTIVFGAGVLAGGAYGMILIGAIVVHAVKRIVQGKPITGKE